MTNEKQAELMAAKGFRKVAPVQGFIQTYERIVSLTGYYVLLCTCGHWTVQVQPSIHRRLFLRCGDLFHNPVAAATYALPHGNSKSRTQT